MTGPVGLYIHIPFCDAKCSYCDFVTFTDRHSQIDSYLKALANELLFYKGLSVKTIFIGGGTPTVLSPAQIDFLFSAVHRTMDTSPLTEATVEANPESATPEKLSAYKRAGINRLSFGLQTTRNSLLGKLGRLHTSETFFSVFNNARELGFDNINVDLMFGLPGQTNQDWEDTLADVEKIRPEHISAYALKIEPGTKMAKENITIDGDVEADMYLMASDFLVKKGFVHYEISNFARPGRESRHNLLYWENNDTIGVGVSSASYFEGKRFKNTSRLPAYLEACLNGRPPEREETILSNSDKRRESIMLQLRLREGVRMEMIQELKVPMASTFLKQGLATVEKGMYSLKPQGWLLSNLLFQQFV